MNRFSLRMILGSTLRRRFGLLAAMAVVAAVGFASAGAFNGRDLAVINIAIPALQAGLRAHQRDLPIGPAILQALFGGMLMQKGFEEAAGVTDSMPEKAWRAKILVSLGASLCESAGDRFVYRMDLGPVWLIADRQGVKFRPGMHGVVAPVLNLAERANFDLGRSLRFGTTAFSRPRNRDGTINSRGALAYSNANNIVTPRDGAHSGHELIHTLQYRRDAFWSPSLGQFFPEFARRLGNGWVDDTGWSVNWGFQMATCGSRGESRDFDMPMEREAYYLTDHLR